MVAKLTAKQIATLQAVLEQYRHQLVASPEDAGTAARPGQPILVAENSGLEIRNIGKTYKKRPVIRDVSLQVHRGEAVGLLGPNGAGKTTSFYIITGLITPDYGDIVLDGEIITNLPMYRRARLGIGYVPQGRRSKGRWRADRRPGTLEHCRRARRSARPGDRSSRSAYW